MIDIFAPYSIDLRWASVLGHQHLTLRGRVREKAKEPVTYRLMAGNTMEWVHEHAHPLHADLLGAQAIVLAINSHTALVLPSCDAQHKMGGGFHG
jgi:hypothetical protein